VEFYRVEQELMARIICEMHERQLYNPAVQSQLNPGSRVLAHASEASSVTSDVESVDDPVIGLFCGNTPLGKITRSPATSENACNA